MNESCAELTELLHGQRCCSRVRSRACGGCGGAAAAAAGTQPVHGRGNDPWPALWCDADVALCCQLVQAEELLETAVHVLLGAGANASNEILAWLRNAQPRHQASRTVVMEVRCLGVPIISCKLAI